MVSETVKKIDANVEQYPFQISVNNPELVKVGHARHDPSELKVIKDRQSGICEGTTSEPTNRKRFTSGLDLVYSTTFPFRIQSEMMRKFRGSAEIETPRKGRMLG